MNKRLNKQNILKNMTLWQKIVLENIIIITILFASNLFIYLQVNKSFQEIDSVYGSNVSLSELSQVFEEVNRSTYQCLTVKSSEALKNYYRNEEQFRKLLEKLNNKKIDNPVKILEKNIRNMSEYYLELSNDAIQAKRGRNVERYKSLYNQAEEVYKYINYNIYDLNSRQFKSNAETYEKLQSAMRYMEIVNSVILFVVMIMGILVLTVLTRETLDPLKNLADTALLVGKGNFCVKVPPAHTEDEIGIVTTAFNAMVDSLGEYMRKTKESMEKEQKMMEKELLMEAHLKEAQLKFFQSQINPHFLFNSLNAGAQLAMLEGADRTCLFMEKMAEFFRYNVKKTLEDSSLEEEIQAVENYIYILNVRFAGDIEYRLEKENMEEAIRVPSMILQPLVENAVNHGIRNVEWDGYVHLKVEKIDNEICISIRDNGIGMSERQIKSILSGECDLQEKEKASTGVGIYNVKSRLEIYYGKSDILNIYSEGENKGTEVVLSLPIKGGEKIV